MIGTLIFVVAFLIIAIWIIIEIKRMKHKIFAIFLIGLILFLFLSVSAVFKDQQIDLTNVSGISDAAKVYFAWLTSAFSNIKEITANVIRMDWGIDR